MIRFFHRLSIFLYCAIVIATTAILLYIGSSYYKLSIEARYFHPYHQMLDSGGLVGHGLGIIGTLFILIGLFSYMARKRLKTFSRIGELKYWLEFHIFLCTEGAVMVAFHTTFKFGGIVSIGFWSLAIVWISGVIGRFIYVQIPRTIEGRELSLQEVKDMRDEMDIVLKNKYGINSAKINTVSRFHLGTELKAQNITRKEFYHVKRMVLNERALNFRIKRLTNMQSLFKYWHVIHLPFALIMLIIMVIHVATVLFFGYKWIF